MKKLLLSFVLVVLLFSTMSSSKAYLSEQWAYWNIKDVFYTLEINKKISKEERDFIVSWFYDAIFNKNKDPDEMYSLAMRMFDEYDNKTRSFLSIVWNNYNDCDYHNNCDYDKNYSSSNKKTYYNKIKDLFYKLYDEKIITSATRSDYINHYYKDIYTYNKNPYSVYKEALEKYEALRENKYNSSLKNTYYKKIKDLFYDLYDYKVITSKQRSQYINDYHDDIFEDNKYSKKVYQEALRKYNSLREDDCDDYYDDNYPYNNYQNYNYDFEDDYDDIYIDTDIYNIWNRLSDTRKYLKYFKEY